MGAEEKERFFGDFIAEFGGVVSVVAADAEDLGGGDGGEEAEVGEGSRVQGRDWEGAGEEVLFGGFHGGDGPEDGVGCIGSARFDVGVAGDEGSVFGGQEFAVAHGQGSLRVSCTSVLGGDWLPEASTAVTR